MSGRDHDLMDLSGFDRVSDLNIFWALIVCRGLAISRILNKIFVFLSSLEIRPGPPFTLFRSKDDLDTTRGIINVFEINRKY